jgi:uncharacterized protein YggU (UPF0235/DUF167 family)
MKITIIAHPNSKKPRIEKDLLETLHIYVSQPPLEGKANNAIRKALADYLKINKSSLLLISGEKSTTKIFEILKS